MLDCHSSKNKKVRGVTEINDLVLHALKLGEARVEELQFSQLQSQSSQLPTTRDRMIRGAERAQKIIS
jgi:hypothetical protein